MEIELAKDGRVSPGLDDLRSRERGPRRARAARASARTSASSTPACPAATAGPPAPASARSSASTRPSWRSARATTAGSARTSSSASPRRTGACSCPIPDEQPGAMPEIAPSPDYGRSIDRPVLRPRDGAPGLGHLRHALARGAPAARRAAGHGPAPARGHAAGAGGPVARGGLEHQARRRRGGRDAPPTRAAPTRPAWRSACRSRASRSATRCRAARRWRRATLDGQPAAYTTVTSNRGVEVLGERAHVGHARAGRHESLSADSRISACSASGGYP